MNNLSITNNTFMWLKKNKCRLAAFILSGTIITTASGCKVAETFVPRGSNYDITKSDKFFNKTIILLGSKLKANGYFIDEDELKTEYYKLIAENKDANPDELYQQLTEIFENRKDNHTIDSLDVDKKNDTSTDIDSNIENDSSENGIIPESDSNQDEIVLEPNLISLANKIRIDNSEKGTKCDIDNIISSLKIINYDNLNITMDEDEMVYLMQGFNDYCSLVYSNNLNGNNNEFIALNELCLNSNDKIIIENLENKMQMLATSELQKEDYDELFNDFYEFYSSDDFNGMTVGAGLLSEQIGNCFLHLFINNVNYDNETSEKVAEFLSPKKDGTCNLDGSKYIMEILNKNNKSKVYCK